MNRSSLIVILLVVGLFVAGGVATGIVLWLTSGGGGPVAEITGLDLRLAGGDSLDIDAVPLRQDLELEASFRCEFGVEGEGELKLTIENRAGDELVGDSFELKSKKGEQKEMLEFRMTEGRGEKVRGRAELEIRSGEEKARDTETVSFTVEEGDVELDFEDALDEATARLREADSAVQDLLDLGIAADDLVEIVADAETALEQATTVEELEEIFNTADAVVTECEARKGSTVDRNQAEETCRSNQSVTYDALLEYYGYEGNFPDSMEDLVSGGYLDDLPACPSGGTYEYYADPSSPQPVPEVYCSVHGSL